MNSIILVIFLLCSTANAHGTKNKQSCNKISSIVNLEFCRSCLSEDEKEPKSTYKEVNTYAQLKRDPRANLPSAFSICSSSMTTYGWTQILFNILGRDGNRWLQPFFEVPDLKTIFYHVRFLDKQLPPVFAHQWVRSCLAIHSEKDFLQWVVDGTLIENGTVDLLIEHKANKPSDLSGKIVLGAFQSLGTKKWEDSWLSNQVTNLNIFSRILTIKEMVEITKGERFASEGDYLAWEDMQWNLNDRAHIEYVNSDETSKSHPSLNLYPAQYNMETCMSFCPKIGSRSPPSVTLQQWEKLQYNLEGLNKQKYIWLALDDSDIEAELQK